MQLNERMRKQQILGIVSMVYDIYESSQGRPPTSTEFFVALNHWQYFGKTPTLENITYGVSKCQIRYNNEKENQNNETCAICDTNMVNKNYPICDTCDDKGNEYEK